jgi:hypothetical protein
MEVNLLNLRNSINKAFLKVRPNRTGLVIHNGKDTNTPVDVGDKDS